MTTLATRLHITVDLDKIVDYAKLFDHVEREAQREELV